MTAGGAGGDPELGARIRELRRAKRLALKSVARPPDGISIQYLSEIERGLKSPTLAVLVWIADGLGTTVVDVLRGLERYGD